MKEIVENSQDADPDTLAKKRQKIKSRPQTINTIAPEFYPIKEQIEDLTNSKDELAAEFEPLKRNLNNESDQLSFDIKEPKAKYKALKTTEEPHAEYLKTNNKESELDMLERNLTKQLFMSETEDEVELRNQCAEFQFDINSAEETFLRTIEVNIAM